MDKTDLAQGAYTCIGSACTEYSNFAANQFLDYFGKYTLNGFLIRLDLPAVVVATAVGNRQFYVAKAHQSRL